MVRHGSRAGPLCVVAVIALITGCTGNIRTPPASGTGSANTGSSNQAVQGAAGCDSASPITTTPSLGPEVQGSGDNATLYGLIMAQTPMPVHADEDVKIVWRMTGSGPLQLSTVSPEGTAVALQWGPEAHGGSNYDRPGDEWGAGYLFPTAGCWRLHAQRTTGSADVWLELAPKVTHRRRLRLR
jgi:hypothetical protein